MYLTNYSSVEEIKETLSKFALFKDYKINITFFSKREEKRIPKEGMVVYSEDFCCVHDYYFSESQKKFFKASSCRDVSWYENDLHSLLFIITNVQTIRRGYQITAASVGWCEPGDERQPIHNISFFYYPEGAAVGRPIERLEFICQVEKAK